MNNTQFFQTCVSLCPKGDVEVAAKKKKKPSVDTNLLKVSTNVLKSINSLSRYLGEIQQEYLLTNSKTFNEHQKKQLEVEMKVQLSKLNAQIQHLQRLTDKLTTNQQQQQQESYILKNLVTLGEYGQYKDTIDETQRIMFTNIVKSLQLKLKSVLNEWTTMFDKRQHRIRELNKSRLDTSNIDRNFEPAQPTEEYRQLQLNEQQQLLLKEEQESIIQSIKATTLNEVDIIESSMMDISSMVRDINLQLNVQNGTIRDLDSQQVEIVSNITLGNKDLVKATNKSKVTNNLIFWSIILASIFLLFVDWLL